MLSEVARQVKNKTNIYVPQEFTDEQFLTKKSEEMFSDEKLAEFKRKTEQAISTTQKNIKDAGWTTPEGFKSNLASMLEASVKDR